MPKKRSKSEQNDKVKVIPEPGPSELVRAAAECEPAVFAHVLANSGTREDAEDLLHDAVLTMHNLAKKGKLNLKASPGAYLLGICKNEWLHRLREKKRHQQVTNQHPVEYKAEDPAEAEWRQAELHRLCVEKLDELDEPCRRLIELDCQGVSLKEIARQLNYSYDYVRQKKLDCLARLMRLIREDKRYKDLI